MLEKRVLAEEHLSDHVNTRGRIHVPHSLEQVQWKLYTPEEQPTCINFKKF